MSRTTDELNNLDDLDVTEDNVDELINQLGQESETDEADADTDKDTDQGAEKEKGEADADAGDDTKKPGDADTDAKDTPADEKATQDDEPQRVIKTRDGKHEIPYSVLESERQKNAELQRKLDELKQRQQALGDKAPEKKPDQDTGKSADKDDFDLEAFREEFGDEAAEAEVKRRIKVEALEKRQVQLEAELAENKKWREDQEAKSRQTAADQVNEAIDSIPTLRDWREKDDPMWHAAVALDQRLMDDPEFKDMSFQQRFEAVVQRLTGQKPKPTEKDLEKEVDTKLAEQEAAGGSVPNSLSDIPGGVNTDQSESDTLERMTPTQLESKLEKMSPDELDAYLARL